MTTHTLANRVVFCFFLTASLTLSLPTIALSQSAPPSKLDAVLQVRSQQISGRSRVIVKFRNGVDSRVITGQGGNIGRRLTTAAQVADLSNRALGGLANNPLVESVRTDHPVFATMERTGAAVAAAVARQEFGLTGKGIGVAVIDSGITSWHDDLYLASTGSARAATRVVHFKDFTVDSSPRVWTSGQAYDPFGHGTHVAGIIAGNGFDSTGKRTGIAPEARLVGLKVLDAQGNGYISDVIAAIDYAIAIKDTYNIRIINLSVASGVYESYNTDEVAQAARRAVEAGIVVVAAAGNLGTNEKGELQWGGITSPGNAPWVLTVGAASHKGTAARSNDVLARFSSRGPTWIDFAAKPDLVAPGVGIESLSDPQSTLYSTLSDYLLDGTRATSYKPYLSLSGTSMAAPVVAGTVALMLEANPKLTPNAIKAILQYTAEVREDESFLAQGAGLLNTLGAIRMAHFFGQPNKGISHVGGDVIEKEYIVWSGHITWGNVRMGEGILHPRANAWATNVMWGDTATSTGRPVVWGVRLPQTLVRHTRGDDNIVWSTRGDDNIVWSTRGDDNIVWSTRGDDNIVWSTRGDDNIVWSTRGDDNIVWSTRGDDNIVWSTRGDDNIVWSTRGDDNIVWSTSCGGANCAGVIWGSQSDTGAIWGTARGDDNIVWSTRGDDNIVWSTRGDDNIVWSTRGDDNIVWSTGAVEQVLWPALATGGR